MRLALISDIHANDAALDAVLKKIRQIGADQIICLGDVATLGPDPRPVLDRLKNLNCDCILGNHDAFMLDPALIHSYTDNPLIIEAIHWGIDQLTRADLDFLRTFKTQVDFPLGDSAGLCAFHGSPDSHLDNILAYTLPDDLDQMLANTNAQILACGHTHIQMLRQHRGRLIVNPGSVGLPFKEAVTTNTPETLDHAEYAVLEVKNGDTAVSLHRIPFDKMSFQQSIQGCKGPIQVLFSLQVK